MWAAIALAFGLAMDATAVSAARGLAAPRSEAVILALVFGGFQSAMAAVGWLAGRASGRYIAAWDHWVAFGLLSLIGGKMIIDGARAGEATGEAAPGTVTLYVGLGLATSIDAAAAGVTLPLVPVAPSVALVLIGAVTAACSVAGFVAGRLAGTQLGPRLAILGGVMLIGIAIELVVSHAA